MGTAIQVDLSFNQILDLVKQLPVKEKIKLSKELEKEGITEMERLFAMLDTFITITKIQRFFNKIN